LFLLTSIEAQFIIQNPTKKMVLVHAISVILIELPKKKKKKKNGIDLQISGQKVCALIKAR